MFAFFFPSSPESILKTSDISNCNSFVGRIVNQSCRASSYECKGHYQMSVGGVVKCLCGVLSNAVGGVIIGM